MKDKGDFKLVETFEDEDVYIISKSLKEKWFNYLWQSLAAGVITFLILFVFSEIIALIILAGVGSTFFTIFALPKLRTASNRNIIGAYLICIVVGLSCTYIYSASLSGGVAISVATLLMVITDTEHPPAAGVALGLAMTPSLDDAYGGSLFALAGAFVAVLVRSLLSPWLEDLV